MYIAADFASGGVAESTEEHRSALDFFVRLCYDMDISMSGGGFLSLSGGPSPYHSSDLTAGARDGEDQTSCFSDRHAAL